MRMTAKERILMIRLMDKLEKHSAYANALCIEATGAEKHRNLPSDPKGLTNP